MLRHLVTPSYSVFQMRFLPLDSKAAPDIILNYKGFTACRGMIADHTPFPIHWFETTLQGSTTLLVWLCMGQQAKMMTADKMCVPRLLKYLWPSVTVALWLAVSTSHTAAASEQQHATAAATEQHQSVAASLAGDEYHWLRHHHKQSHYLKVKARCRGTKQRWCGHYLHQPLLPAKLPPAFSMTCPNDCSKVGVCNAMTGVCDCPAGEESITVLVQHIMYAATASIRRASSRYVREEHRNMTMLQSSTALLQGEAG